MKSDIGEEVQEEGLRHPNESDEHIRSCPSCRVPFLRLKTCLPNDEDRYRTQHDNDDSNTFQSLFNMTLEKSSSSSSDQYEVRNSSNWVVRAARIGNKNMSDNDHHDEGSISVQLWCGDDLVKEFEHAGRVKKENLILWMRNCPINLVADPCLKAAAQQCGAPWSVSHISDVLAQVISFFCRTEIANETDLNDDHDIVSKVIPGHTSFCKHGILLDNRILVSLVIDSKKMPLRADGTDHLHGGSGTNVEAYSSTATSVCGMYNIVDLTHATIERARLESNRPIKEDLLEVAEEEECISAKDFYEMSEWTTRNCTTPLRCVKKHKWAHILFISHRWAKRGVPGSLEDLDTMKKAVKTYIAKALENGPTTLVKNYRSEEDFGVWVDYPIIPNDPKHKDCPTCNHRRKVYLAKMAALPVTSTTIALHPKDDKRGWILHELTLNSHGNIVDTNGDKIADVYLHDHASRINLMINKRVFFTNGSDGSALRCVELVRLGQMPRVWPSVTRQLLKEWGEHDIESESIPEAKDILFKYARTFHFDCQRLKRFMVTMPQKLARHAIPQFEDGEWVDVYPVPPEANVAFDPDPSFERPNEETPPAASGVTTLFDLSDILEAIKQQKVDMEELGLSQAVCEGAEKLQFLQFLYVTMGLRAELMYGGGYLHWISLSSVVQALTTAKRSIRLIKNEHVVQKASCSINMTDSVSSFDMSALPDESIDIINAGVSEESLQFAFRRLFVELRPTLANTEQYLSGVTAAWKDDI